MIDRVAARPRPARWSRCRSASSGSSTACVDGSFGFGGEESAGASFLRRDGTVWTTDKDGIILDLLAGEITAVTGRDPGELYRELDGALRRRRSTSASTRRPRRAQKARARQALAGAGDGRRAGRRADRRAGSPARPATTRRSAGSRWSTENGWFAARPSGTEDIYKIYAESFKGREHLARIQDEAQAIVTAALGA